MVREILLLGNKQLYEVCDAVEKKEVSCLKNTINDLHVFFRSVRLCYETKKMYNRIHGYGLEEMNSIIWTGYWLPCGQLIINLLL